MRIDRIPDDAVLIRGTLDDYVDPRGNVYGHNHRNNQPVYPYIKEKQCHFGYEYVLVNYISGKKKKRLHRVVAETFIENPHGYPIVMHIDNNKKNNHVSNLMWGTVSMNTQQAVDDGLLVNAKGSDDSQSVSCDMYDSVSNKRIRQFGSCKEAERETGISASTIMRQVLHPEKTVRKSVYFTAHDAGARDHDIVIMFDKETDDIIGKFPNCSKACSATGIPAKVINECINLGRKPKWCKYSAYFKRMYLKGEEVIEINQRVE